MKKGYVRYVILALWVGLAGLAVLGGAVVYQYRKLPHIAEERAKRTAAKERQARLHAALKAARAEFGMGKDEFFDYEELKAGAREYGWVLAPRHPSFGHTMSDDIIDGVLAEEEIELGELIFMYAWTEKPGRQKVGVYATATNATAHPLKSVVLPVPKGAETVTSVRVDIGEMYETVEWSGWKKVDAGRSVVRPTEDGAEIFVDFAPLTVPAGVYFHVEAWADSPLVFGVQETWRSPTHVGRWGADIFGPADMAADVVVVEGLEYAEAGEGGRHTWHGTRLTPGDAITWTVEPGPAYPRLPGPPPVPTVKGVE